MINWPAVIKLVGEAELVFVESQQAWDADPHLSNAHYQPNDVLIDSCGNEYLVNSNGEDVVIPQESGKTWTLNDVIQLVRMHAAQDGACCASKLNAASIGDAISLVR